MGMMQDAIWVVFSHPAPLNMLFMLFYLSVFQICLLNDRVSDRPVNLSLLYISFLRAHNPPLNPISRVTPLQ